MKILAGLAVAAVLIGALAGWLHGRTGSQAKLARHVGGDFTLDDCDRFFAEASNASCGWLEVPRDHGATTQDGLLALPIVVIHPRRPNGRAVLIPGGGGPGSSVGFAWVDQLAELMPGSKALLDAGFSVVLVEERGVGWSTPDGSCDEYLALLGPVWDGQWSLHTQVERYARATADCRSRLLRSGYRPHHWMLSQSASDMVWLMRTLPFDRWSLFATSHATVVALATANLEPAGLEQLVLDSPVNVAEEQPLTYELMQTAVANGLARCSAEIACDARYPNLRARLESILARAADRPYEVRLNYWDLAGNEQWIDARIDRWRLLDVLFESAYWPDRLAQLPATLEALEDNDVSLLRDHAVELLDAYADTQFGDANANSTTCGFYLPRQREFLSANPATRPGWSMASETVFRGVEALCQRWNGPLSPLSDQALLDTPLPTLVLSGGLDPITPAANAQRLVNELANAAIWIDPLAGHSVASASACARERTVAFLNGRDDADCTPDTTIGWIL